MAKTRTALAVLGKTVGRSLLETLLAAVICGVAQWQSTSLVSEELRFQADALHLPFGRLRAVLARYSA